MVDLLCRRSPIARFKDARFNRSLHPVLERVEDRVLLSSYTVTSTGDSTSGSGTSGTLPYVIGQADEDAGGVITFDSALFNSSSPQTIDLDSTLDLTATSGSIVIDGPGAGVVSISGQGRVGDFDVAKGVNATISGLTITDGGSTYAGDGVENFGTLGLDNCTISGNSAVSGGGGSGGGVENYKGTVDLSGCTISDNSAGAFGGGFFNDYGTAAFNDCKIEGNKASGDGGGLDNDNGATATLAGCTISDNAASGTGGGGVANRMVGSTVTLTDCTIIGNTSGDFNDSPGFGGGGLKNYEGTANLTDCTIIGNTAMFGGGVEDVNSGSMTTLTGCTISGNSAEDDGGGLINLNAMTLTGCTVSSNSAANNGGGLFNDAGLATFTDSTIYGNHATSVGGGLTLDEGSVALTACTISGNIAGGDIGGGLEIGDSDDTATLTDTIIAGNVGSNGSASDFTNYNGKITASHNLIGTGGSGGITDGDGNILGVADPLLGPLAEDGGPTATMALLADSPAIGAGVYISGDPYDQRGIQRPQGSVDIGAFQTVEASPTTGLPSSITSTTATLNASVNPEGTDTSAWFIWGISQPPMTRLGKQDIGEGTDFVPVSATLTGLTSNTTYWYDVVASNAAGETTGTIGSFTTSIAQSAAMLSFGNLSFTYNGSAQAPTVMTSPPGLTGVSLTYSQNGVMVGDPTAVGTYQVTASLDNPNDMAPSITGTLSINSADLTITVNDATKIAGQPNPPFSVQYSGFVPGQGPSVLSGNLSFSTSATTSSPPGAYAIVASGLTSSNYQITYFPGTLTVGPAPASLSFGDLSFIYNGLAQVPTVITNPPGLSEVTLSYSKDGQAVSVPTAAGTYAVMASLDNPTDTGIPITGTMIIQPEPLTITANNASMVAGQPTPTFSAQYSGFVPGEGPGVLVGTLTFSTPVTLASPAGAYAIVPGGLTSSNYQITYVDGTLTVTPVPSPAPTPTIAPSPSPSFTPLVTVTSLQWERVKVARKRSTKELVISFTGALDSGDADVLSDYTLDSAGRRKNATVYTKPVPLTSASYTAAANRVTLALRGKPPARSMQLTINAAGLLDAEGREFDGNGDGQPGGDFVATLNGSGVVSMARTIVEDHAGRATTAAIDAIIADGSVAGMIRRGHGHRRVYVER